MRERETKPKGEEYQGGIRPDMAEYLRKRSEWFGAVTQGRGKPMKYGSGEPPSTKSKAAKK